MMIPPPFYSKQPTGHPMKANIFITSMFCGCEGKRKAKVQKHQQSVDSPFQVRLIKMLGLHSIILDKFVFRRKPSSYSIRNIKGVNALYLQNCHYQSPDYYRTQVEVLQSKDNSVPVIRIYPVNLKEDETVPCIVYAHGNSSDMGDSLRFITHMAGKFKAQYVAFDYTGYGESQRSDVGEDVICKDLELVLAWLNRPTDQIILWGFSLGTYPVTVNAAKYKIKAAVLQCPIGSLSCMFYDEYQRDIKFKEDHFANIDYIAELTGRILLLHSTADEIIPIEQARLLYSKYIARNGDRMIEFIEVEKIKHNAFHRYIIAQPSNELQREVLAFLSLNQEQMQKLETISPNLQLQELSLNIRTVQLPQEFQEQDFQMSETQQKSHAKTTTSSQQWLCYRK